MKTLLISLLLLVSASSSAIDAYSTSGEGVKKLVKNIVKVLKLESSTEMEKKIFDTMDYAFEDNTMWNSYWLGYDDLSVSKMKDSKVTFIEYFINSEKHGMFFFSFLYDKESQQILVNRKQIRYASKKVALDAYTEKKDDTEKYNSRHETDTYALLQVKGKVDFSGFNIGTAAGSATYFDQRIIDLNPEP